MRIGQSKQDREMMAEARRLFTVEGNARGALDLYYKVLKRWPREPELHTLIGSALIDLGNIADARKHLLKAIDRRPEARSLRQLARTYEVEGRTKETLESLKKALKLAPNSAAIRSAIADAHYVEANYDEALEAISGLIDEDPPDLNVVLTLARIAHRVDMEERAIEVVRAFLERGEITARMEMALRFRLGELLNRAGHYDEAFECFAKANKLRNLEYSAASFSSAVDQVIETWTRERIAELPVVAKPNEMPILIVGMPRSGTSLAEQIIASHSQVAAGGELKDLSDIARSIGAAPQTPPIITDPDVITMQKLTRHGRAYLSTLRKIARGSARVTDKMPTNFLFLGLAQVMLPGARVVHCVRDPRDTCLSCFFQSFSDALAFTNDLSDLGVFYRGYERLMAHWREVLDIPVFDLVYADLVNDLTGVSRELIGFLGLEWEDQCETFWLNPTLATTASLDQIRRPIYTSSVGRWKNYEAHLAPLEQALGGDLVGR